MKFKLITFVLLLTYCNLFCQNSSGKISYKLILPQNEITTTKKSSEAQVEAEEIMQGIANELANTEFILLFKNEESSFKSNENLNPKDSFYKKMGYKLFSKYTFYTNLDKNKTYKKDNTESGLTIKIDNSNLYWEISNQTKKIGEYTCYKATCIKEFYNNKGLRKKDIIAWFCPELPYQFGPLEFNGLPGLILELQDNKIIYLAKKIELSSNKVNIEKPSKNIITEEEYIKKLKENSPF